MPYQTRRREGGVGLQLIQLLLRCERLRPTILVTDTVGVACLCLVACLSLSGNVCFPACVPAACLSNCLSTFLSVSISLVIGNSVRSICISYLCGDRVCYRDASVRY